MIEKVIKVPELLPEPVLNITVPKLALAPKAILVPDLNQTVVSQPRIPCNAAGNCCSEKRQRKSAST